MADFIRANRLGIAVAPTDEEAIERGLRQLLDSPVDAWARAAPRPLRRALRAAEMGAILESCCSTAGTRPPAAPAAAAGRSHV